MSDTIKSFAHLHSILFDLLVRNIFERWYFERSTMNSWCQMYMYTHASTDRKMSHFSLTWYKFHSFKFLFFEKYNFFDTLSYNRYLCVVVKGLQHYPLNWYPAGIVFYYLDSVVLAVPNQHVSLLVCGHPWWLLELSVRCSVLSKLKQNLPTIIRYVDATVAYKLIFKKPVKIKWEILCHWLRKSFFQIKSWPWQYILTTFLSKYHGSLFYKNKKQILCFHAFIHVISSLCIFLLLLKISIQFFFLVFCT